VLTTGVVVTASVLYLMLLFAVAYYGDRRAAAGRSVISNGWVYALSLAVYATSWTYYGSVGSAASTGIGFLPIYLGPTVMVALWWVVLRKIIRICKVARITSLADFVSARYGRSALLGGLVTVMAVVGVTPYIALQLKAVSGTFTLLRTPDPAATVTSVPVLQDTALYLALLLAAFTILFGTRHLDASERHEGMVAAIATESIVKLVAFLAVGAWVTFGLFAGPGDLMSRARAQPEIAALFTPNGTVGYGQWFWLVVLAMLAVLLLPRQWQVAVVENVDERHVRHAMVLFPGYLIAMNVFVVPIALAGLLTFGRGADADTFVLALPLSEGRAALALLVFIGGLSAATGMVIVETVALSTMVSNSLVMPLLLHGRARWVDRADLRGLVLGVRRASIVAVLLLGFGYVRAAGEGLTLVSIGLLSFAAVAQFAPAVLGGLFWKGATRRGAVAGLVGGFTVWTYTLLLPSFTLAGWLPTSFVTDGPFGVRLLAPHALLGLDGLDPTSHGMLWSMIVNVGGFVALSVTGAAGPQEHMQASRFVDALSPDRSGPDTLWRGTATVGQLRGLLERFVGPERAAAALAQDAVGGADLSATAPATADLVHHVELLLAGSVGSASARVMMASVVQEEPLGLAEVMEILDEASQVRTYSRALERQSRELEEATAELRAANDRLQELDRLKDEFVSTVTHELRTPLTSIRSFSEILLDDPDLPVEERRGFLAIVVQESERLTRLINQVLDLSKLESGTDDWRREIVDLRDVVTASVRAQAQVLRDRGVAVSLELPDDGPPALVTADRDRIMQVMVNLLSNGAKFADPDHGHVRVELRVSGATVRVEVEDNGRGIAPGEQQAIFEKFRQSGDTRYGRPAGTGLGLPISRQIVSRLGGSLDVRSASGKGATFSFTLPLAARGSVGSDARTEGP
jgi:Na+/proline symporter/signal transduction histidine kinase